MPGLIDCCFPNAEPWFWLVVTSQVPWCGFGWWFLHKCRGGAVASPKVVVGWLLLHWWCRVGLVVASQMPRHGFGWIFLHKCRGVVFSSQVSWSSCCFGSVVVVLWDVSNTHPGISVGLGCTHHRSSLYALVVGWLLFVNVWSLTEARWCLQVLSQRMVVSYCFLAVIS